MLGLGAVGVAVGAPLQDRVSRTLAGLQSADPTGLSGLVPGAGGFRYYSVTSTRPAVHPDDYRLEVSGLVRTPTAFSFADLAALPQTTLVRDFQCVTGWRVPDVRWSGVLLRDVLAVVGPTARGSALRLTSLDGTYTESLTLEQATRDDVMVATRLDDAPISRDHGGPARLLVAPMYGYKSLKWLGGLEVVDRVIPGYWEELGYDVDAWVGRSNGRDDEPV